MRLRRWARLAAFAACTALAPAAPAQEAAPAPAAKPEPAPPAPQAIPLPELSAAADRAEQLARDASVPVASAAVERIGAELDALAPSLSERGGRLASLESEAPSLEGLGQEERFWALARDQLATWNRELTPLLEQLERRNDELAAQREVWQLTQDGAVLGGAPAEVLQRISTLRSKLKAAQSAVRAERKSVLAFQARVVDQEAVARGALEKIAKRRATLRDQLFWRDSPPLWALRPPAAGAEPTSAALRADATDALEATQLFLRRRIGAVGLLGAGLFVLLLGARRAAPLAPAWQQDPQLAPYAVLLERPYAAALLLALIAANALLARAPAALFGVAAAAVVAPTLRLLPRLVAPVWRPALVLLGGLVLADAARALTRETLPGLERVLLLVECVASALVLGRLATGERAERLARTPRRRRWLRLALRLAVALLATAAVANLFGYANLAHLVGGGALRAGGLAAVALAGLGVVRVALHAALRSPPAQRLSVLRRRLPLVASRGENVAGVVAAVAWAWLSLATFDLLDDVRQLGAGLLSASAKFGEISVSLGDIVAFALTLVVALLVARVLRLFLEEDVLPHFPTRRGVGYALTKSAEYVLVAIGATLAAAAAGIDFDRITLLAGAFGVGVGFGLQNVVSNFVSGLILLYERPIQLNDLVQVGDVFGEVKRIGIRSSTIRTVQGAEVIVPNASLVSDRVTNWTLSDSMGRIELKVGVAYGTEPERVIELLRQTAAAHTDVLEEPEPAALFRAFGESSLDFELRCWVKRFDRFPQVQSDLAVAVYRALREANIEIPFPQRDLHVRTLPAQEPGSD